MPPATLAPSAPSSTSLVATLFYKADTPHYFPHPDASPRSPTDPIPSASLESLKDGAIPTDNLSSYPLEPPTPGPNPLDHIYGSYISQNCLTDFFSTLVTIVPTLSKDAIESRRLQQ